MWTRTYQRTLNQFDHAELIADEHFYRRLCALAGALRCALVLDPALKAIDEIVKDKKHPQRLAAAKEILERNGFEAFGKPADPKTAIYQPPTQQTQVNVSTYHFEKLSEDELNFAERVFRAARAELDPAKTP